MKETSLLCALLLAAACSGTERGAPPTPQSVPAPLLVGMSVMVFPVQYGSVPVGVAELRHFPLDRQQLDGEIAYWLPQNAPGVRWILPETIQRAITRSPTLDIDINNLAVTVFQQAQVKRIGDPLFGDLRRLAAVLNARLALIPVAAERIGATQDSARVQIATTVIDAHDGTVVWFGIIESDSTALGVDAGIASAAQTMARTFGGRRNQEMQNR